MKKTIGRAIMVGLLFCCAHSSRAGAPSECYYPPPESQGVWRKLESAEETCRLAAMDPRKLAELRQWLLESDERDFAAVCWQSAGGHPTH